MWWITERAHTWRDDHQRIGWVIHVWPFILFGLSFLIFGAVDWSHWGGKIDVALGVRCPG